MIISLLHSCRELREPASLSVAFPQVPGILFSPCRLSFLFFQQLLVFTPSRDPGQASVAMVSTLKLARQLAANWPCCAGTQVLPGSHGSSLTPSPAADLEWTWAAPFPIRELWWPSIICVLLLTSAVKTGRGEWGQSGTERELEHREPGLTTGSHVGSLRGRPCYLPAVLHVGPQQLAAALVTMLGAESLGVFAQDLCRSSAEDRCGS